MTEPNVRLPIPSDLLEAFPNPYPDSTYSITHVQPEFTHVCPLTGQPDFGTITIEYTPGANCVELKSLKFYLQSYRNEGAFYERLTNDILNDLVTLLNPRHMQVTYDTQPRGGIHSRIVAYYNAQG